MILFPKVSSSAPSLIFNINDGILRILIDHASKLGKYQDQRRRTERDSQWKYQGISGKISGKIPAEYQGNIREYEGKYQHPNWENISKREELTVEPAFAKMSGEPSIWTEGTAKKSGLKALKKKSGLRSDNIFNIFLNLIT